MQLYPNLTFDGQCEAAFQFYEQCFHGRTVFSMTYAESPQGPPVPPDWGSKITHATFAHPDFTLHGADVPPDRYQKPQGFSLQLNLSDPTEAERIFNTLAEAGTVQMPVQETFWALRFGVLVDRFGIPWLVNCEQTR